MLGRASELGPRRRSLAVPHEFTSARDRLAPPRLATAATAGAGASPSARDGAGGGEHADDEGAESEGHQQESAERCREDARRREVYGHVALVQKEEPAGGDRETRRGEGRKSTRLN